MAPEGSSLEESNRNLDEITDLALQLQTQTGVKVLWVTCNLFAHQRFSASTRWKRRDWFMLESEYFSQRETKRSAGT